MQHTHAATIRNKEANRAMREALASREAKREGAFAHHCGSLSDGAKLADAIGARLEVFEAADRAKYRQQFEQWNEKVYVERRCSCCSTTTTGLPRARHDCTPAERRCSCCYQYYYWAASTTTTPAPLPACCVLPLLPHYYYTTLLLLTNWLTN